MFPTLRVRVRRTGLLGLLSLHLCSPTIFAQVALSPVAIAGSDLEAYAASTPFTNMVNQSAASLDGGFVDVPGNPQGTYTISKASLAAVEFFRTRRD